MAVYNSMLNIMPYHCRYCIQGWYGMQHISEEARKTGMLLIELEKEQAEKNPVWDTLATEDPVFVNGFGHGGDGIFTGDSETAIFTTEECSILSGRIIYLLSCYTARALGPAIIDAGGIAYGGYDIAWTWAANSVEVDPYTDWYAEGYYRASNEFPIALIQGETVGDARDRCIAEYNRWIEIWETERADDQHAAEVVKWLIHDRDGLTVLGHLAATIRTAPPESVVLSINSEPVPAPFVLDGIEIITPWSGEVTGGLHVIEIPRVFERNGLFYGFRHWENGSTKLRRGLWLEKDIAVTATYEATNAHTLTVNSQPLTDIEFSLDGERLKTSYSELREEAFYTVKFPLRFQRNTTWYGFDHWEDGSTEPERTINLTADTALTAYYKVLPIHTLTVNSFYDTLEFSTSVKVDGERQDTPVTLGLPEGSHTLEAPASICQMPQGFTFGFREWQDGSIDRIREINLTADTSYSAYFDVIGGKIPLAAKDMLTGEDLNLYFIWDGREAPWKTPVDLTCVAFKEHTIEMPAEHDGFVFDHWEDGSTNPVRTFTLDQWILELTAYYKPAAAHILKVNSEPVAGVLVKVDGELVGETPRTITVIEGQHTVEVPTEVER